jgi:hypothetical protein
MGILVGYLNHEYQKIKITKFIEIIFWVIAFISSFLILFWTTSWMNSESMTESPGRVHRLVFKALYKTTWGILPAWIIFIHAMGRAGIAEKINCKMFQNLKGFHLLNN